MNLMRRDSSRFGTGKLLKGDDAEVFAKVSFLTLDEVYRIESLLEKLDADNSGTISGEELQRLPELVYNPFTHRIVRIFDVNGSGDLELEELLDLFSSFSHRATVRSKAQRIFCIFDFDEDGELGQEDLEKVLGRMLMIPKESIKMGSTGMGSRLGSLAGSPEELTAKMEANIKQWAKAMIAEVDTTGTGTISYDEWEEGITMCESFHDFATFPVASNSSIEAAAAKLDRLTKEKDFLRSDEMQHRRDHSTSKEAAGMTRFSNPLDPTDGEDLEEVRENHEPWQELHPSGRLLANVPFLELINDVRFSQKLEAVLEPVSSPADDIVVPLGTQTMTMYFVAAGEIGVFKTDEDEEPFHVLREGDVFGERAIITALPADASYASMGGAHRNGSEAQPGKGHALLYRLGRKALYKLLADDENAMAAFTAPAEVKIAAKIRTLKFDYETDTFAGKRPPSLEDRVRFHRQETQEEELAEEELAAIEQFVNMTLEVPIKVVTTATERIEKITGKVQNPLWQAQISSVQAKYGRGVSTTFQLQRWIGQQNLRVALLWFIFCILPRQFALIRYCDRFSALWEVREGCVSEIADGDDAGTGFGYVARDVAHAQEMEAKAFTTPGSKTGDRIWSFYQYSGFAPTMGDSFLLTHFTMLYGLCIIFIYSTTVRSLLKKMYSVLAGNPVLGSGTESIAGLQNKSDGFFSVLAGYDFSIRTAESVSAMQDGLYTRLEVIDAAAKHKEGKERQTTKERMLIWAGWGLYVGLVMLCGLLIFLILSDDWIRETCCACGCTTRGGTCSDLTSDFLAYRNDQTGNVTWEPAEFCSDPFFECEDCSTGWRNPLLSLKEDPTSTFGKYVQPLLLSFTTATIPFLTKKISIVEQRQDEAEEMKTTLIRVFFLKMFNIGLMFLDLTKVAERSVDICLEDTVGSLFRRMVITDAFVYSMMTLVMYAMVKYQRKGKKIEYDSIRAAQEAINVMYRQVITWVATVTSPMMPLLTFAVSNYLMGVEFWALTYVFRPPTRPWSAVKTVTSFMALTFLSLLISTLPTTVWMTDVRRCGPFEGIKPVNAPGIFVRNLFQNMTCHETLGAELPDGVQCEGLTRTGCSQYAAIDLCEWRGQEESATSVRAPESLCARTRSLSDTSEMRVRSQIIFSAVETLAQIVTSSPFLLSLVGVLGAGLYFVQARLERWEHEVAVLRETADGERKFLVKKLRSLHETVHRGDQDDVKKSLGKELDELNKMKQDEYNGAGTIATDPAEYKRQHMGTRDMGRKQGLEYKKKKREERLKRRDVRANPRATAPVLRPVSERVATLSMQEKRAQELQEMEERLSPGAGERESFESEDPAAEEEKSAKAKRFNPLSRKSK